VPGSRRIVFTPGGYLSGLTTSRKPSRAGLLLAVGLFLLVVLVGVWVRPPLARDETRYLSVAWAMWLSGDWLVPHINGETYSHKPPVLFWLINAGWRVMGVSEWWARLAGPLCGVGCLGLTWRLAKLLWPHSHDGHSHPHHARAWIAPLVLATCVGWMVFASLTMFDAPLTLCVLAALIGLVQARRGMPVRGFLIAGLAMGVGVLTKGPVVFLHVLPVALLAPWWAVPWGGRPHLVPGTRGLAWYLGVFGATVLAVGVALAWALPAAKAGGEKFANEILWGQSAGRMVQSFRHARPWWFFIPIVPALLFPWSAWPPVWRAVARIGPLWHDAGVRFLLSWLVPGFVAFSLVSGKQAHYLLPMLAGVALLLSRLLPVENADREERGDQRPIAVVLMIAGLALMAFPIALAAFPALAEKIEAQPWAFEHHPVGVGVLIGLGMLLLLWDARGLARRVPLVACVTAGVFAVAQWDAMRVARPSLDLAPMGEVLRAMEQDGRPIAHLGEYHGQYHFVGRIEKPFALIWDTGAAAWARKNPSGVVVGAYDRWPVEGAGTPLVTQASGSHTIVAWSSGQVLSGEAMLNQRGSRTRDLLPTGERAGGGQGEPTATPSADEE
jgi:4-amino-4-deoxy-L-arabinose transferase-like glycosyltransferase